MSKVSKNRLKMIDSAFWSEAEKLNLTSDRRFLDAVDAYEYQTKLIAGLREKIGDQYQIPTPVGKGFKMVSNPSIGDLNKAEILAQKLRMEIDSKLDKARQAKPPEAELTL